MPTEDRRIGKLLPSPVTPPDTVCFTIEIPNATQYRAAFLGQINVLGMALTWDHPTDGTECPDCEEAAQLWRNAIYNATWSDECGVDPMSCEDIADCIETSDAVKEALANAILTNEDIRRAMEVADRVGAEMGETQLNAPISNGGPDCDLDILFAQVTGIVDQMHTNNLDFLEIMSAASTPGKRLAQVLSAIPVIETLPVDDAVAWVAKMYDEIVTNYNAQWTTSLRDEYRCGLFCIARDMPECELTYDTLFNYINNRLENAVEVGNLVASVVQYTLLGTWYGSTVVDIMMLNQVAIWRAAGNWLGVALRTLQMVSSLGGNIPDSDWMILCTDCPPTYQWEGYKIDGFQPDDTNFGTIIIDEPGHMKAQAGYSYGAYRIQQRLIEPYNCFKIVTMVYPTIEYPHNTDCDGHEFEGMYPAVDTCCAAMVGASESPFTIEIWFEAC